MDVRKNILLGFGRVGASTYEEKYLNCAIQRLESLEMRVTVGDPGTWDRTFDYSPYGIVALIASCNPVKDPGHLLSMISSGALGFIVFGAWNATSTLKYVGLLQDDRVKVKHQSARNVCRTADTHHITSHLQPTKAYNFGTKYVSCALQPGPQTRVLLHVDGDAALLVHSKLRICLSHWTGDPTQHEQEAPESIECLRRCLQWAAGASGAADDRSSLKATSQDGSALKHPAPIDPRRPQLPSQAHPPSPLAGPRASLLHDLWRLLDNEEYADVVFVFPERRLYANRALLSVRCPFLKQWIDRERQAQLAAYGGGDTPLEIHVGEDISPEALYLVFAYLYTTSMPTGLPPTTLLNVLITAQDCSLTELKQTCEDLILGAVEATNVVSLLVAAHQLQQAEIKDMALDFIVRHMDEVKSTRTLDQLRDHPELMLALLSL